MIGDRQFRNTLAWISVAFAAATLSHAQLTIRAWDSNSDARFGRNQNWTSNNAPDTTSEAAVFNGTGSQTTLTMNANRTIGGFVFTNGSNAITFNRNGSDRLVQLNTTNEPNSLGILHERSWTTHTFNSRLQLNTSQIWRTTADGGKLLFTDDVNLQSFTLTLDAQSSNQGEITFSGANGVITGTGGLTKTGAGTVFITGGSHTYTGATTVNSGIFQVNASNVLSDSSNLVINSGGTFQFDWGSLAETMGSLSGDGTLSIRGSSFTTNTSANTTFSGLITDSWGQFHKAGTGDLTLTGANTYSGITYIDGGTLIAANNSALGTSTYGNVIANGATLGLQGNINLDESNFSLQGTGEGGVGAINNISGNNTLGASLSFTGATTIGANAGTLTLSNSLDIGNALTFTGSGNVVASGQAYGSSSLTKTGTGNLTLSGTVGNSFSGGTFINNGTVTLAKTAGTDALGSSGVINVGDGSGAANSARLVLGANNQISDSAGLMTIASDGQFSLGTYSEALNQIGGAGSLDLGSGALEVGTNSGSSTFSGVISGTGTLTKSGSGTLTLNGSSGNTFTGTTTVNEGTLVLNKSAGNAITGNLTLGDASGTDTLRLDAANQIADTSNLTLASSGVFNLNNNNETIGSIASASSASSITLGSGTLTTGASNATTTFAGAISGTGGLTTTGDSHLTLSGNNTFSGNITVASGTTLVAASNNALGTGGTTTVQSGGTLAFQGGISSTTETMINLAGTGDGGNGALLNLSGTNTLVSNITLTGATTIGSTGGTLQIGNPANPAWPIQGTIAMGANDLTFAATGGNIFLRETLTGTGDVYKTGSGTLTVKNGFNDGSTADFFIQDGTLILDTFNNENLGIMGDITVGDGSGAAGSARFQQGELESGSGLSNNLIADTSNIIINADGYWDIQGYKEVVNNVTLNGGTIEAKNNSGTGDRLDIIGVLSAAGGTTSTIDGRLGMNNDTAKSIVVSAGSTLDINAVLSNGGFDKTGDGTLILSGANSFTGTAKISDGIVRVDNNSGLGATAGGTQVLSGAQLQLDNVTIGSEALSLAGTGHNADGTGALRALTGTSNTWGGNVSLTANAEIQTDASAALVINGGITGSGRTLTVDSIGTTTFNGINTFNTLNKTGAGTLTVTNSNIYATANVNAGTFALGASNLLTDTMDINLGAAGTFQVGSYTEVIDDLNGSGTLTIASGGDLTIDQIGNAGAFTGILDVDGILTLNGGTIGAASGAGSTGTIELTANNTLNIAGNFTFGGTLELGDNTTLNLVNNGTVFNVDTLRVTGDSVIDFAGVNVATLNIGTLEIDLNGTILATSWASFYDLWTATNFNGAILDERNGTTAQITFNGFDPAQTIWLTYDYGANEITVPEPSTYGAILMGTALAGYLWRRRKRRAGL